MINFSASKVGSKLVQIPQTIKQVSCKIAQAVSNVFKKAFAAVVHFFESFKKTTNKPTPNPIPLPPRRLPRPVPDPNLVCVICLNDDRLMNDQNAEFLHCAHRFHQTCLDQWLPANPPHSNKCPACNLPNPRIVA